MFLEYCNKRVDQRPSGTVKVKFRPYPRVSCTQVMKNEVGRLSLLVERKISSPLRKLVMNL